VLIPEPREWLKYFDRALPSPSTNEDYERHMKFGPTRDYWNDFVFEACVNYKSGGIYLAGVPDIPASRPHSAVSQPFDDSARKQNWCTERPFRRRPEVARGQSECLQIGGSGLKKNSEATRKSTRSRLAPRLTAAKPFCWRCLPPGLSPGNIETGTLKSTLKLEQLTCSTPDMVAKEIDMGIAAYNLVRIDLSGVAAERHSSSRVQFHQSAENSPGVWSRPRRRAAQPNVLPIPDTYGNAEIRHECPRHMPTLRGVPQLPRPRRSTLSRQRHG
jgi:hypothetical protein